MTVQLLLSDILTTHVITVTADQKVQNALSLMRQHRVSAIVVVDGLQPVGIFTERDAVLFKHKRRDDKETSMNQVMAHPVISAPPNLEYREGYRLISKNRVRHLVITDNSNNLCGVVSEGDFLKHLGGEFLVRFKEVGTLMTEKVLTLTEDARVSDAIRLMARERISCAVVEKEGRPIGIFTERDLVNLQSQDGTESRPLETVMSSPVRSVTSKTPLPEAMRIMDETGTRRLIVVGKQGLILGLLTRHDIVKQLYDAHVDHLQKALERSQQELDETRSALRIAEQLHATETRLQTIVETIPHGIQDNDAEGTITYSNPAHHQMLGYKDGELIGRRIWDLPYTLEEQNNLRNYFCRLLATQPKPKPFISAHRKKNGQKIWVQIDWNYKRDAQGNVVGFTSIITDVTEQKAANDRLTKLASDLARAQSVANLGNWSYRIQDGSIEWSDQTFHIFGRKRDIDTLNYQSLISWIHPEDRDDHNEYLKQMLSLTPGKKMENLQYRLIRPDGEMRWVEITNECEFDEKGQPVLFFGTVTDITDRRKSEQALVTSEEKFRALFEQTGGYCMILDPNTEDGIPLIVDANDAACSMHGYTREEFIGRPIADIDDEDGKRMIKQRTAEIMTGKPFYVENTHVRQDGSTFSVAVNANRIDIDGSAPLIFTTEFDVSQRVEAENNLRNSEERLRLSTEVAGVAVWEYDLLKDEMARSSNHDSLYGLRQQDIWVTETFLNCTHPDDRNRANEIVQGSIQAGGPDRYSFDFRVIWPDDSVHWLEVVGEVTERTPEGVATLVRGCLMDITDRKLAEGALRSSEELLREAQHIAHIAHWTFNPATGMPFWSDELYRIYGRDPADGPLPYEEHPKLVHPDDWEQFDSIVKSTAESGNPFDIVFRIVRPDGSERVVNSICQPLKDDTGAVVEMRGTIQDITDAHILERQLQQAQKMESIGRLAGGIAHDFNNMLGVILGYSELILARSKPEDRIYSQVSQIKEAADRSASLTKQLLTFSRQQAVSPEIIDLNESVSGMHEMLKRLIGEDIDLLWLPGENLWPVEVDPSQLDQILANLAVNARDAISGIGKLTIQTENTSFDASSANYQQEIPTGQYVMLSIRDNGCGMDSQQLEKIFEPFYTTKEQGKGTGLGLATVYGVVKQNGGFINVDSELGKGSCFRIYLPKQALVETQASVSDHKNEVLEQGKETILLVEDEPLILEITTTMLESVGYTVIATDSPTKAIQLANQHSNTVKLLLSDVVMPEMNGRDLSEKILSLHPHFKCLFMSGYTADVIASQDILENGTNLIHKPFSVDELTTKVREAIGGECESSAA